MPAPIILENSHLRLTLDPATGAVLALRNLATETDYLTPPASPRPPFIVDAYSANQAVFIHDPFEAQNGGFSLYVPERDAGKPGDLRFLREPLEGGVEMTVEREGDLQRAVCACQLPGGIRVTYTVTLRAYSPLLEWQVRVENPGAPAVRDDLRVYRVAFPALEGLTMGGRPEDNWLARPFAQGELIPDPVAYEYRLARVLDQSSPESPLTEPSPTHVLTYPGWASLPWLDLYGPGGGLYLASYDPTFQQLDLETWPDRAAGALTLDLRTLAFLEPGESWDSQRFVVGVHGGDWHWAADRYREWALAHHRPYAGPRWVREECDGWFGTGGPAPYASYLQMWEDARWLGLDYLQIWSEMLEPTRADGKRKMYYCYLWPDPRRGGEAGLAAAVRAVREAGGHVGFYYNLWTWDAEIERTLEPWRPELPPDAPVPTWWGGMRRSASVFPSGERMAGDYVDGYAGMCPVARDLQDYILSWVADRYVERYGVDAWYFDSMPVSMFGAARVCFSDEHGPGRPHGVGRGMLELLDRLTRATRPTVNLAITSETVSDALMQYQSHALGLEMNLALTRYPRPEIYSYTFPEHPIFSGSCNNSGAGLIYYYPEMTEPRREDAMNRVFLMGFRFDILFGQVNREDPYALHLRRLIALRQQVKADLYRGLFRDNLGLGALPERVEARLFQSRDRASLTLTLLDRRGPQQAPFDLTLTLPTHGLATVEAATLYRLDGQPAPLRYEQAEGVLTLHLPALQAEVAAVVLKTGTP